MRSRHGCAARSRIRVIGGIVTRARVGSWSTDIRLCTIALISRDRAAAAKASNSVCSGVQSSYRVGRLIKRRRIGHRGTTGAGVTGSYYHLDTSSFLSFNSGLQLPAGNATLRDRATPGVNGNVRRFGRIALSPADWVGSEEKFHALDVCGWRAISLVHVAARNPLCAGPHPVLLVPAIVSDRCARSMAAMKEIVTRLWRVRA